MTRLYRKVVCPTCGKQIEWRPENTWKPFCSERCKLIDLGAWATENYRLPDTGQDDFQPPEQQD